DGMATQEKCSRRPSEAQMPQPWREPKHLSIGWGREDTWGYAFDATRIGSRRCRGLITTTRGQLMYDWLHLWRKLRRRNPGRYKHSRSVRVPSAHPLFKIVPGQVESWERIR